MYYYLEQVNILEQACARERSAVSSWNTEGHAFFLCKTLCLVSWQEHKQGHKGDIS